MFDNLREDWRTYERDLARQGLWVMAVYRFGRWRYGIQNRWLRLPFSILYKILKLLSQILTGIDLPCEVTVGRRFKIEHFGDIIISGDTVFGDDVVIRNGVTVGLKRTNERGAPVIGNRVTTSSPNTVSPLMMMSPKCSILKRRPTVTSQGRSMPVRICDSSLRIL
jgi:serine O-acetyltransferase